MVNIINKIKNYRGSILDRYILLQVIFASLICVTLFIIVWIAPETLLKVVRRLLTGEYNAWEAFRKLALETAKILANAIPVGILLGSIFTFDRLSKNSELAIMRGIGLSFTRIMAPVIALGAVLAIFCYFVNDKVIPVASQKLGEAKALGTNFVYVLENPDGTPKQSIIVQDFNTNSITNVTVMNFAKEKYTDATTFESILFAKSACKEKDKWVLNNVNFYEIDSNGIYKKIKKIPHIPILEEEGKAQEVFDLMLNTTKKERLFTNYQISMHTNLLKKAKFSDEFRYFKAKLYQRYLHPLTCILFAIIGCMLGFSPPRSQRLIGFTIAVGMVFAYYITLPFFDMLAQKAVLTPFLAAAFPMILFITTIFIIKKVKDL